MGVLSKREETAAPVFGKEFFSFPLVLRQLSSHSIPSFHTEIEIEMEIEIERATLSVEL